jgi:hypothetical protein
MNGVVDHMMNSLTAGNASKKGKYVDILDTYCTRDDDSHEFDIDQIDDDHYADEEDFTPRQSSWNARKKQIENRSRGWLNRFASDNSRVKKDPEHGSRSQSTESVVINLKEPVKPRIISIPDLESFKDATLQSNFCLTCWSLVTAGPTRVCCEHCPVVIHRYCISNLSDFFVDEEPSECPLDKLPETPLQKVIESSRRSKAESEKPNAHLKSLHAFRRDRTSHANRKSGYPQVGQATISENNEPDSSCTKSSRVEVEQDTSSVRRVLWTCPFCVHEVLPLCANAYCR